MAARKKATQSSKARTAKAAAPKKARATAKASAKSTVKASAKVTKASAKTAVKTTAAAKSFAISAQKPIAQKQSKSQIYAELADLANVSKHDVKNIISAMRNLIERHLKPKGSGQIVFNDLGIKVRRAQKKASKARMGRNPFTGEEIQIPAKPARKSVKVSALKTLKALIEG